jgi:RND family efflux transporter MFP subunit
MSLKNGVLAAVLFLILGILFFYLGGAFTSKVALQSSPIEQVDTSNLQTRQLKMQAWPTTREFTGVIIAEQQATISARLTAKVAEVLVDVGAQVKQGDVLMRLESDDLSARVRQNEQGISSAQAQLNVSRKEFERINDLVGKKLLPQAEFDRAESQLKSAEANFKQAQAYLSEAETTFGYSVITAPFDGVITAKSVNVGDTAAPGANLLSLYNPNSLQVETQIPESLIPHLAIGNEIDVSLPTINQHVTAVINEITPSADTSSRSFAVRLDFTVDDDIAIYPGLYAIPTVVTGEESYIRLHKHEYYQVGQLDYVKVFVDGKVLTRLVQLGDNARVTSGLTEDEWLIQNP